jgi:hypothetical protein
MSGVSKIRARTLSFLSRSSRKVFVPTSSVTFEAVSAVRGLHDRQADVRAAVSFMDTRDSALGFELGAGLIFCGCSVPISVVCIPARREAQVGC